jgi:membrane-associated phospholipid phosphatase
MSATIWDAVSHLAAQPVMLAVGLVAPAMLALGGRRRMAACWLLVVGGALGLVLLLKLVGALVWPLGGGVLRSTSGHTAAGGLIWGGVALAAGMAPRAALALGLAATTAVAVARVASGLHHPGEVFFGALIGLGALALLARWHRPAPPGWRRRSLLLAVGVASLAAAPWTLHPEPMVQALAHWLRAGLLP